jgi:two-component system phosphate regulon sensor histidine kinase PhoR
VYRRVWVYVLIPAVFLASAGLAYYSFRYSNVETRALVDSMREVAAERISNIESKIIGHDEDIFASIDIENLASFGKRAATKPWPVKSVRVLDDNWSIVPGSAYDQRDSDELQQFMRLFQTQIVPDLRRQTIPEDARGHLHKTYDGRPYLFSFTRRTDDDRTYYIVIEEDLIYQVGTVFPQFFHASQRHVYEVVDEQGAMPFTFRYDFSDIPESHVVTLPFPETFSGWRLRVALRESSLVAARNDRRIMDLVLIGMAVVVVFAGVGGLIVAERHARKANELKSDFISNVSHELKTPLSIISMFGEMLAMGRTKSTDQATEYARIITQESVRLARLIDNVLDFARIERGMDVYEFAEGDLGDVVDRSMDIYRHRLEQDAIELEIHRDAELPPVRIDENAMTLALLNLVDNALKYAAGGGRLEITLRRHGDGVALAVRDRGPGIAPDEQSRVFERFYRARAARTDRVRGSGIGLALVKHIAEAHGGRVDLDSELGAGTTFTIWIPAAPSLAVAERAS